MSIFTSKEQLLDKLKYNPENFIDKDFSNLQKYNVTPKELNELLHKLYSVNKGTILNNSRANSGIIGKLNEISRNRKNKKFWKTVKKSKKRSKISKVILAEGDSWFEFPFFIREITDQIIKKKRDYALYSLAYAGDWMANILYEQEYIEMLSLIQPDVFLISGGGNDLLGDMRLAKLLKPRNSNPKLEENVFSKMDKDEKNIFVKSCLNKNYYRLIRLLEFNYRYLFYSIEVKSSKFKKLQIITQGYYYVIPSSKRGINPILHFLKNGHWLEEPLTLRGYVDMDEKKAIVCYLIDELNQMLIRVGKDYKNVHHIDLRGVVNPNKGWHDELHPNSRSFEKIAELYIKCIRSFKTQEKIN